MRKQGNLSISPHEVVHSLLPEELQHPSVLLLIRLALAEDLTLDANLETREGDLVSKDITSLATLPEDSLLRGQIKVKAYGVVAGIPIAAAVFALLDPGVIFEKKTQDGERVEPGTLVATVRGRGKSLLAGERTALNFLGRMSGIATLTRKFVEAVGGTQAVILDTRKTTPGHRYLDKYSVRMGGGNNHRAGLFDMILIKDNHISGAGGITAAVDRVREMYGGKYPIEVEVKNRVELEEAIGLGVDRIMLDNMDLDTMRIAVSICKGRIPLEASGNVNLDNIRLIAETGVNFISSGALTHSAPTLDISMKLG